MFHKIPLPTTTAETTKVEFLLHSLRGYETMFSDSEFNSEMDYASLYLILAKAIEVVENQHDDADSTEFWRLIKTVCVARAVGPIGRLYFEQDLIIGL